MKKAVFFIDFPDKCDIITFGVGMQNSAYIIQKQKGELLYAKYRYIGE